MTTLTGPSLYRDGFNLQPHQTLERVVLPAEIQKLPPLEGYLCIAGYDRARVALQWAEPKRRAPAFLLRRDTEEAIRPQESASNPAKTAQKLRSQQDSSPEGWD